jgi:hypothetical protein
MKKLASFLVAALTMLVTVGHANAQSQCAETKVARDFHATQRQEAPVLIGIINNGNIMEVWRTADSKNFAITVSLPNGTTCLIATGSDLQSVIWHLKPKGPKV